jgi:hypothetical protein
MSINRNTHAGKSPAEKHAYQQMLKTQQAEDPTYEREEYESTDSVVVNEVGKSALTKNSC